MSPTKSSNKDTIAAMIASSRPRNPNLEKIKVTHGFIEEDGRITPRQPGEGEAREDQEN